MKNILITGASSGIGLGLVKIFINNGYYVIAVGRNIESLKSLFIPKEKLIIVQDDITNMLHQNKVLSALSKLDSIKIINSAAIGVPVPFRDLDMKELREHFETNFFAPIQLLKFILGQNPVTKVLNISSGAALFPLDSLFSYCNSKSALHHAIKCLNLEYPDTKFSNLRPGMVATPLQERWRQANSTIFPKGNYYIAAKEEGKLIKIEDVADFVYWVVDTTDEFKPEWNIYDEEHHPYWLKSKLLPD